MSDVSEVDTPVGPARVHRYPARGAARLRLLLGHGAGGGVESADLQALAAALPAHGVEVVLVEQPWRVAGRKVAPAPKTLDAGWTPVAQELATATPRLPQVFGGRSAGARVACRTAALLGAVGVLALAFPLHPPGRPEKSRAEELLGAGVPALVVQGARDPFGAPAEFPPEADVVALPAGDHGFAVRRAEPPVIPALVTAATAWLTRLPV